MRDVTYKSHPMTVREVLLLERVATQHEYRSLVNLIVWRTDLTYEEVLEMDVDDTAPIFEKIAEGMDMGNKLKKMWRDAAGPEDEPDA